MSVRPALTCVVACLALLPVGKTHGQPMTRPSTSPAPGELPPGHVQGDVVSYSYVPIRTWAPKEGIGILPYLFEYNLMAFDDRQPLENLHAENVRRIDIASHWSTAIQLYNRHDRFRDEIVNLMIRCYRHRQLIILSARPSIKEGKNGFENLGHILDQLWGARDTELVDPEGDRATGSQLINNILAASVGDEEECGLGTDGLERLFADFDRQIRLREKDDRRPFSHIKAWFNMIGYAALDYNGCYAASQNDIEKHRRVKLPPNTQAIGVDVYHYWFHQYSPFDPADLSIPRARVRAHADEWQRIRTRYYPEGLQVRVCKDSSNPATWTPECWNDTHALMDAIQLAEARNAMMWYIAVCGQLGPAGKETTYTTPIETMQAYYDHLKAGPWVALAWWVFGSHQTCRGGLEYYDRTLKHYTPAHPHGEPYTPEMLDYWQKEYVAFKTRIFNDVVYGQFRHLNGSTPKKVGGR
ncbi:MAG: hypothetical protein KA354_00925 [Phycisphaerae bacterium]|nr:hypothetical protein [Phycisphaerae bacterium]